MTHQYQKYLAGEITIMEFLSGIDEQAAPPVPVNDPPGSYEARKRALPNDLTPAQYQREIMKICRDLGV